ncbi:NAD(+)/NADH kinase [Treponema sp. OMZ 840]|uniref:NAD(+)/NADH kinase n=1 Tax=Treponema sp. OMZ 840 TaxID=244313 RepID=UPI003D8F2151
MICVVVVNTYKKAAESLYEKMAQFLNDAGHTVVRSDFSGSDTPFPVSEYDCAITLGGDGTVLYASRRCAPSGKPVVPVNLGEFGFIAGIRPDNWQASLSDFFAGKIKLTKRSLVKAEVVRRGTTVYVGTALNDMVLSAAQAAKIVEVDIRTSHSAFGKFKADALIISTSTGSTAYSAAAGGPIVDPDLDVLILNTVSAFSLSNRPLVLPSDIRLSLEVLPSRTQDFVLSCDGQVHIPVEPNDSIFIKKAEHSVLLAGCDSSVFYTALRSKLHWSGGPRA